MEQFEKELAQLINKHSLENFGDIPDFILARFIVKIMLDTAEMSRLRDGWYGFKPFGKESNAV